MLVRRDAMRASKAMQDRAINHEKIEIMRNTTLLAINGAGEGTLMNGVTTQNVQTNDQMDIEAAGLFYAIGHTPNTEFVADQVKLDDAGYIVTQP
jgi:thioredoxin reductase (NADPH)